MSSIPIKQWFADLSRRILGRSAHPVAIRVSNPCLAQDPLRQTLHVLRISPSQLHHQLYTAIPFCSCLDILIQNGNLSIACSAFDVWFSGGLCRCSLRHSSSFLAQWAFHNKWPMGCRCIRLSGHIWYVSSTIQKDDILTCLAGVNWPGHVDAMIPEGLQYRSISDIISMAKSVGINSIRLTYATEMIDQIESNGGVDVTVQAALVAALGQDNGTAIFEKVLSHNPSFSSNTTRLEVSRCSDFEDDSSAKSSLPRSLTQSRVQRKKMKSMCTSTTIYPSLAGVATP